MKEFLPSRNQTSPHVRIDVEQAKGQNLEELSHRPAEALRVGALDTSQVVQEFVIKIRDLRNNLAPEILKLRNTRNVAQQRRGDERSFSVVESDDDEFAFFAAKLLLASFFLELLSFGLRIFPCFVVS